MKSYISLAFRSTSRDSTLFLFLHREGCAAGTSGAASSTRSPSSSTMWTTMTREWISSPTCPKQILSQGNLGIYPVFSLGYKISELPSPNDSHPKPINPINVCQMSQDCLWFSHKISRSAPKTVPASTVLWDWADSSGQTRVANPSIRVPSRQGQLQWSG